MINKIQAGHILPRLNPESGLYGMFSACLARLLEQDRPMLCINGVNAVMLQVEYEYGYTL